MGELTWRFNGGLRLSSLPIVKPSKGKNKQVIHIAHNISIYGVPGTDYIAFC